MNFAQGIKIAELVINILGIGASIGKNKLDDIKQQKMIDEAVEKKVREALEQMMKNGMES